MYINIEAVNSRLQVFMFTKQSFTSTSQLIDSLVRLEFWWGCIHKRAWESTTVSGRQHNNANINTAIILKLITVPSLHHKAAGEFDFADTSEQALYLQTKQDVCKVDGDIAAGVAAIQDQMKWAVALCTRCGTVLTLQAIWSAVEFSCSRISSGGRKGGGGRGVAGAKMSLCWAPLSCALFPPTHSDS